MAADVIPFYAAVRSSLKRKQIYNLLPSELIELEKMSLAGKIYDISDYLYVFATPIGKVLNRRYNVVSSSNYYTFVGSQYRDEISMLRKYYNVMAFAMEDWVTYTIPIDGSYELYLAEIFNDKENLIEKIKSLLDVKVSSVTIETKIPQYDSIIYQDPISVFHLPGFLKFTIKL